MKPIKSIPVLLASSLLLISVPGTHLHAAEASGDTGTQETADTLYTDIFSAKPGDTVRLGFYDQPLSWKVLKKEGGRLLLTTVELVDEMPYDSETDKRYTNWEKSTIRRWLNEDFYREAFTKSEQKIIADTEITTYSPVFVPVDCDDDFIKTQDKIFILSEEERDILLNTKELFNGTMVSDDMTGLDWVIDPDWDAENSKTNKYVRPAMWIDLGNSSAKQEKKESAAQIDTVFSSAIGETVTLGNYSGEEVIWKILAEEDDRRLLITDEVLLTTAYSENDSGESVTPWNASELRERLNTVVYNELFSENEKQYVCEYAADIQRDSYDDKLLLLSKDEVELYLPTNEGRVFTDRHSWILRPDEAEKYFLSGVDEDGNIIVEEYRQQNENLGIRPAVWVSKKPLDYENIHLKQELEAIKNAEIGITDVRFGNYHGDQYWRVYERNNGQALLIANDAPLESSYTNPDLGSVNWQSSNVRKVLNRVFYNNAFTEQEKSVIAKTNVQNAKGDDTKDRVFLLGLAEVIKYFPEKSDRVLVKSYQTDQTSGDNIAWWTRTARAKVKARSVLEDGVIEDYGDSVDVSYGLRPVVWVNYEASAEGTEPLSYEVDDDRRLIVYEEDGKTKTMKNPWLEDEEYLEDPYAYLETNALQKESENVSTVGSFSDVVPGDRVTFGNYHGSDKWICLKKDEDSILLLSVDVVDVMPYYNISENSYANTGEWAHSDMRVWLNTEYLDEAFSDEEIALLKTQVHTDFNGEARKDRVFLLDEDEIESYIQSDEDKMGKPSAWALQKDPDLEDGYCDWWIRTSGYAGDYTTQLMPTDLESWSCAFVDEPHGVRPAICIATN